MAITDNLAFYAAFDTGGGAIDSIAGNNGVEYNIGRGTGVIGSSEVFSGSNAYALFPSTFPDTQTNTPFSFSFWIKTTMTTGACLGTHHDNSNAHAQWNIYTGVYTTNSLELQIHPTNNAGDSLWAYASNAGLNDGNWHHVVITYSGNRLCSGVKFYVDNSQKTTNVSLNTLSSNAPTGIPAYIGNRGSAGAPFTGELDEFAMWTREITASEVTSLYNSGSAWPYPFALNLASNLDGFWKLDGDSTDVAGGNDGVDSVIDYSAANGKIVQGAGFNGTSSKITLSPMTIVPPYSICAWVKPNALGMTGNHRIFEHRYDTSFSLNLDGAGTSYDLTVGVGNSITTPIPQVNKWDFLVATVGGGVDKLYLNGVKVSQGSANPASVNNRLRIGNVTVNENDIAWPGAIDEVGLWSRILTDTEVLQLHNSARGNAYPFTATPDLYGAVNYWSFDGNAEDVIGHRNGTVSGATYTTGKIGSGLNWGTGTNSNVVFVPNQVDSPSWSVAGWAKPTTEGGTIYAMTNSGGIYCRHCSMTNTQIGVGVDVGGNFYGLAQAMTVTSAWHHFVCTYDDSTKTFTLFFDGVSVKTGTVASTPTGRTGTGVIGSFAFNNITNQGFKGYIDEVGTWNRALSSTEVATLYNAGSGLSYPFTNTILTVSTMDSINASEFVSNQTVGKISISVSGSLNISESLTKTNPLRDIVVYDHLNASEFIASENKYPYYVDNLYITESVNTTGQLGDTNISNTINIAEGIVIAFALSVSVADTLRGSEDITSRSQINLVLNEALVISENINSVAIINISVSDAGTFSEQVGYESFLFSHGLPPIASKGSSI